MKRVKNLFPILISDENIERAIDQVDRTHRWARGKPNRVTVWVERTKAERVKELREIILNGFEPKPARHRRRYDQSAGKWRDIWEPAQWPDQYVHHMIVQVLQPVMMRGMDYWCCGSIKERGTKRGINGLDKWIRKDPKNTKYAAELDVYHFYESLTPKVVMDRMRQLVKDKKILDVIWRLVRNGILIGAYFSQWFANTVLQPLDHLIREKLHIKHYVRYMDNLTLFSRSKKELHRVVRAIDDWLHGIGLRLKGNWQVFRTSCRMVSGMGYRYGIDRTLEKRRGIRRYRIILRKRNLLRLKRQLARAYKRLDQGRPILFKTAAGLLSRIGQLKRCNSYYIRKRYIRPGFQKILKNIVRAEMKRRKEKMTWQFNTCLAT